MPSLTFDLDNFRRRVLQDCLQQALPAFWSRRAAEFDAVQPDEIPLPLYASPEQVAKASPAAQTALSCRRHAFLLAGGLPDFVEHEIDMILDEAI